MFYDFLGEYAEFFSSMEQFEQHKLSILLGGTLGEIESTLSLAQANAKKLENLEQRRMQLQQEAGLGDMSLSQLADTTKGERSSQLRRQLNSLTNSLSNIRFYNQKSMEVAQDNLRRHGQRPTVQEHRGYGSRREPMQESQHGTHLQAKV